MRRPSTFLVVVLLCLISYSFCYKYTLQQMPINSGALFHTSHAMVTAEDAWFGSERAFINIDVDIYWKQPERLNLINATLSGRIYVVIFPEELDSEVEFNVNYMHFRERCIDWMSAQSPVHKLGNSDNVWYISHPYVGSPGPPFVLLTSIHVNFLIPRSSVWSVIIVHCENRPSPLIDSVLDYEQREVWVNGSIEIMNPFGYASAFSYPIQIIATSIIVVVYILLLIFWIVRCFMYPQDIHLYQKLAIPLFFLGIIDTSIDLALLTRVNIVGYLPPSLMYLAVVMSTLLYAAARLAWHRDQLSRSNRMLALFLSGFYVVVFSTNVVVQFAPQLSGPTASAHYRLMAYSQMNQLMVSLLLIPTAVIEIVYVGWIFCALEGTMRKLRHPPTRRNYEFKRRIYNKVQLVTIVLFIIGTVMALIRIMHTSLPYLTLVDYSWAYELAWRIYYCLAIAWTALWIFVPSSNNSEFSFTDVQDPLEARGDEAPQRVPIADAEDSDCESADDPLLKQRSEFLHGLRVSIPELFFVPGSQASYANTSSMRENSSLDDSSSGECASLVPRRRKINVTDNEVELSEF